MADYDEDAWWHPDEAPDPLDGAYQAVAAASGALRIHALADLAASLFEVGDDAGGFEALAAAMDTVDEEVCSHHRPLSSIEADLLAASPAERAVVLLELGEAARAWWHLELALTSFRAGAELCTGSSDDAELRAWCLAGEAAVLVDLGRPRVAVEKHREAAELFWSLELAHAAGEEWSAAARARIFAGGDRTACLADRARAEDAYLSIGDVGCAAYEHAVQGFDLMALGADVAAVSHFERVHHLLSDGVRAYVDEQHVIALERLGLEEEALERCEGAIEGLVRAGDPERAEQLRRFRARLRLRTKRRHGECAGSEGTERTD